MTHFGDKRYEIIRHSESENPPKRGHFTDSDAALKWVGGKKPFQLVGDIAYCTTRGDVIHVYDGYRSDLYSVPWLGRRLIPKAGQDPNPAIIHDVLCDMRSTSGFGSDSVHEILCNAMKASPDFPKWRRKWICRMVRWFGPKWKC